MELDPKLHEKIVELFSTLPNIRNRDMQLVLLLQAGLDPQLEAQIPTGQPPVPFADNLVTTLVNYEKLSDGRYALEAVLEAAKTYVGQSRQDECDSLIQQLPDRNIKGKRQAEPSFILRNRIIDFLKSLPNIHDANTQRALIHHVDLDSQLYDQISFGHPPSIFVPLLVLMLNRYGNLSDGRNALEALLETTRSYIGRVRYDELDSLIQDLQKLNVFVTQDMQILKQIENKIGEKIALYEYDDNRIETAPNIYAINENKNIIGLNLYGNNLAVLPNTITQLTNLQKLVLTNNQFKKFPIDLLKLSSLTTLYLGHNQLTELPETIIELKHLQYLSLNANQFKRLPLTIKQLNNFRELDLRNNFISELPKEIGDLEIPIKWDVDEKHEGLYIAGNPFEKPPIEIVKRGREAIKIYLDDLEGDDQSLKEVKVLLVGEGGAGKTSLIKRLLGEGFDPHEPQTDGININEWYAIKKKKNTYRKVNFWDFGGQEIMHATHQFFLSKRSLYILVLDGRKEEDAEYWLKLIESFGGSSPIIVVLNKIDQHCSFDVNRRFLQEKYQGIKGFFRLSCADGTGIQEFVSKLIETLEDVEILQTTWIKSWFHVKKQLENLVDSFISYDKYIKICEDASITEPAIQETLIDLLHDLGVILHFKEFELSDIQVLDPKWVTNAVYKIINSPQLGESNGELPLSLLSTILKRDQETDYEYPREKYRYIIDLMMKFELCYEIDKRKVLIPDLLEIQEPLIEFDYTQSLKFLIQYDFLPKSIMPRFIVKMHKDIKDSLRWRTGVVLEDSDLYTIALIKADERDKRIYIYVNGERKREHFSIIRKTLREINNNFEKLSFVELVPLPEDEHVTVEYQELIGLELMGQRDITIGKLRKQYSVKRLLNGLEEEEERKDRYSQEGRTIYNIHGNEVTIGTSTKEVRNMSKISVELGDGAIIHGDFVVANKIKDSFNKVDSSNVSDNLKELLKKLATEVGKMSEELPKEQAEQVANDLQALTNEATSEKPRKKWWKLSAEGLKEAAQGVGEVGKTALMLLTELIPVLEQVS